MADSTPTATPSNDTESCFFRRTVTHAPFVHFSPSPTFISKVVLSSPKMVTLYDWWLVKAKNDFQGKRLAVAGVSSREGEAKRVFVSAPVIKRHDEFFLETADGKYVMICGFINEQRTIENGIAPEVFHGFVFGFPQNWESYALNFSREESTTGTDLGSAFLDDIPASCPEIPSDVAENCIRTALVSPEEAPGEHEKQFPGHDCNVSKATGGVNLVCSGGGKRCSARLHDIKVGLQKKQVASAGISKHPDNEENSSSVAFENCDIEGLRSPATPIQSQSRSEHSIDARVENCIPPVSASPEKAQGDHEKAFPENEYDVSKKVGGLNVTCGRGGKRRSENPKNPETPIQSQSRRQLRTSSEQIVKISESRISTTLSPKLEKNKKKVGMSKGIRNKSASAVKKSRLKDQSHFTKGSQQKISTASPESSSFRTSRSGRLLLPPLEFWRNQIPIYNADHELKEIQDGESLISPCRVSSPSLSSPQIMERSLHRRKQNMMFYFMRTTRSSCNTRIHKPDL